MHYRDVYNYCEQGRGKSVRLSFNPVGEVTCNDMKIGSTYFNDFLARQGAARLNPRKLSTSRHTTGAKHVCRKSTARCSPNSKYTGIIKTLRAISSAKPC